MFFPVDYMIKLWNKGQLRSWKSHEVVVDHSAGQKCVADQIRTTYPSFPPSHCPDAVPSI